MNKSKHQRGAALLMALMTVALIAMLAAAGVWQQWRTVSVETAERQAQQSRWLLAGAQDWARVVLREDGRNGGADHLAEPWALPLQEARLSTFLAANASGVLASDTGLADQVFLSGRITDMQSRLNLSNLVVNGQIDADEWRIWQRLYLQMGLPEAELRSWTSRLKTAMQTHPPANADVVPQRVEQLSWLGMSHHSLLRLAPHITVLPTPTTINLNTASAEVLFASIPGLDMHTAQQWVSARNNKPWDSLNDFRQRMGPLAQAVSDKRHNVNSAYFEITGQLRFQDSVMAEHSLVRREGIVSKTVWREHQPWYSAQGCISRIQPPC